MLMQLGAVQFAVEPLNTNRVDHAGSASYAMHPVLGDMPPSEFTGEGPEHWRIRGKLFPQKFGGLPELEALHAMRRSGQPHFLMRGDGVPMGWVVIDEVSERSSYLDAGGVGRVIEIDIAVHRASAPSADRVLVMLLGLLQ